MLLFTYNIFCSVLYIYVDMYTFFLQLCIAHLLTNLGLVNLCWILPQLMNLWSQLFFTPCMVQLQRRPQIIILTGQTKWQWWSCPQSTMKSLNLCRSMLKNSVLLRKIIPPSQCEFQELCLSHFVTCDTRCVRHFTTGSHLLTTNKPVLSWSDTVAVTQDQDQQFFFTRSQFFKKNHQHKIGDILSVIKSAISILCVLLNHHVSEVVMFDESW